MKVSRFLSIAVFVTLFAVLYVYQQTEIFRLAYVGQKRMAEFEELLDKNSILRYNIGRSASLVRISDKICESAEFKMPDSCRLVRLMQPKEGGQLAQQRLAKKENVISRFFSVKRQAEANTISP